MSRRRAKGELQFGSDSFLDVVANIVGILIILIVLAGLRVSKMPVLSVSAVPTAENSATSAAALPPTIEEEKPDEAPVAAIASPAPAIKPERPPLPELTVPKELVDLLGDLQTEITSLKNEEASLVINLKDVDLKQIELTERKKAISAMLSQSAVEIDANRQRAKAHEIDMDLARETLERLIKQVEELEDKPVNVQTVEHKITPISRAVNGKEKHFRLEKNRVSEVPVDELVSRLKEQIDRRKDWLVKTRQHKGQIGPVRGYVMEYLVRVDTLSPLDELRAGGQGGYRISLTGWEIQPEPETRGETVEVALKKGSQFYQAIIGAAPDTTLTFWVYPDSYPIYRKLQKFSHDHGFSVAGRPLPTGIPISGSPNGSKSASQ